MAEPNPSTGVYLWHMEQTSFFVKRFSAPGGLEHGKVWEEQLKMLKKVKLIIILSNEFINEYVESKKHSTIIIDSISICVSFRD